MIEPHSFSHTPLGKGKVGKRVAPKRLTTILNWICSRSVCIFWCKSTIVLDASVGVLFDQAVQKTTLRLIPAYMLLQIDSCCSDCREITDVFVMGAPLPASAAGSVVVVAGVAVLVVIAAVQAIREIPVMGDTSMAERMMLTLSLLRRSFSDERGQSPYILLLSLPMPAWRMVSTFSRKAAYSTWMPTNAYTGERGGLARSRRGREEDRATREGRPGWTWWQLLWRRLRPEGRPAGRAYAIGSFASFATKHPGV